MGTTAAKMQNFSSYWTPRRNFHFFFPHKNASFVSAMAVVIVFTQNARLASSYFEQSIDTVPVLPQPWYGKTMVGLNIMLALHCKHPFNGFTKCLKHSSLLGNFSLNTQMRAHYLASWHY